MNPTDIPLTSEGQQASLSFLWNQKPRTIRASEDGRYWARTSDPQLVELVLSQLS
jgi:hypothetical protein